MESVRREKRKKKEWFCKVSQAVNRSGHLSTRRSFSLSLTVFRRFFRYFFSYLITPRPDLADRVTFRPTPASLLYYCNSLYIVTLADSLHRKNKNKEKKRKRPFLLFVTFITLTLARREEKRKLPLFLLVLVYHIQWTIE